MNANYCHGGSLPSLARLGSPVGTADDGSRNDDATRVPDNALINIEENYVIAISLPTLVLRQVAKRLNDKPHLLAAG